MTTFIEYIQNIFVPTTVHIPTKILAAAQRRAKALGISRNRLIVQALERELERPSAWSTGFLDALRNTGDDEKAAVDDMLEHIRRNRRSKKAPIL